MVDSRFSDIGSRRAEDVTDYGVSQRLGFGRERLACLSDRPGAADVPLLSAELFALHQYWLSRRRGHRFPSRADIDPLDIPYLLGNVMLVDVRREPPSFCVRLHGSSMAERLGRDLTGQNLSQTPALDSRANVVRCCAKVLADEAPLIENGRDSRHNRTWAYEALWLPLATDDRIDMLLCAEICHVERPAHAPVLDEAVVTKAGHEVIIQD